MKKIFVLIGVAILALTACNQDLINTDFDEGKYPATFRVIDKENGNYGSCVNKGLQEAKGKYVKVLDADDTFAREEFNGYVDFLKETDADL